MIRLHSGRPALIVVTTDEFSQRCFGWGIRDRHRSRSKSRHGPRSLALDVQVFSWRVQLRAMATHDLTNRGPRDSMNRL